MLRNIKKFLKEYEAQIIIAAVVLLIFNPYSRAFYKSALLISEVIPNSKIRPLHIFTKEPILDEITYKSGNKEIFADLYLPNERGKHPATVLDLGLDIDRKDPRVQKIASGLARLGIIVLAPNIPSISERRLTQDSPRELADSYKYLTSLNNLVDEKKTGFMAFCGASAPAFISAQSPDLKNKVDFFVTIDPYYDLPDLYKEVTTKKINGEPWIPHAKTVEVFNREAISQVENDQDRKLLLDILVHISPDKLSKGDYGKVDPAKVFITSEAKTTYLELTNTDPKKTDYYLSIFPEKQKKSLQNLSASTYVKDFKPKTFILTERPSPYLPYTQAESYHKNLKGSFLEEVDFTSSGSSIKISFPDGAKSFFFVWKILNYLGS